MNQFKIALIIEIFNAYVNDYIWTPKVLFFSLEHIAIVPKHIFHFFRECEWYLLHFFSLISMLFCFPNLLNIRFNEKQTNKKKNLFVF